MAVSRAQTQHVKRERMQSTGEGVGTLDLSVGDDVKAESSLSGSLVLADLRRSNLIKRHCWKESKKDRATRPGLPQAAAAQAGPQGLRKSFCNELPLSQGHLIFEGILSYFSYSHLTFLEFKSCTV